MCGIVDDPECPEAGKHRDREKANIKKSEDAVQRTEAAIHSFLNPFWIPAPEDPVDDRLYSLHSGALVLLEVEVDVMRADSLDEQEKQDFINQRLKNHEKSFFDPIKRNNLMTMENANKKVILATSQGKVNTFVYDIQ